MKSIPETNVDILNDESLQTCVEQRSKIQSKNYDLFSLDKLIKRLLADTAISSLSFRVGKLAHNY